MVVWPLADPWHAISSKNGFLLKASITTALSTLTYFNIVFNGSYMSWKLLERQATEFTSYANKNVTIFFKYRVFISQRKAVIPSNWQTCSIAPDCLFSVWVSTIIISIQTRIWIALWCSIMLLRTLLTPRLASMSIDCLSLITSITLTTHDDIFSNRLINLKTHPLQVILIFNQLLSRNISQILLRLSTSQNTVMSGPITNGATPTLLKEFSYDSIIIFSIAIFLFWKGQRHAFTVVDVDGEFFGGHFCRWVVIWRVSLFIVGVNFVFLDWLLHQ